MKKIIVAIALVASVGALQNCAETQKTLNQMTTQNDSSLSLTGTKWKLVELAGKKVTLPEGSSAEITLQNGQVTGSNGCNRISGAYSVNEKTSKITFSQVASTKMACMDQNAILVESGMNELFTKVDSYLLTNNQLQLSKGRVLTLAKFEKVQ